MTAYDITARLSADPGQDTAAHLMVLYSIARFLPARLALEIGVDDGSTTLPLLVGVAEHGGHLFSVDPAPCEWAKVAVEKSWYGDQWHFSQLKSADLAAEIQPGSLDLIFVDGDHSYEGVRADWLNYRDKVRVGGLVLFHDYCNTEDFPGIAKLIDEEIRPEWETWGVAVLRYGWGLAVVERRR
jgi:predicted O-methyltransferase YrrM